jgi:hypothetical protein
VALGQQFSPVSYNTINAPCVCYLDLVWCTQLGPQYKGAQCDPIQKIKMCWLVDCTVF